jgi:hypothetical protein
MSENPTTSTALRVNVRYGAVSFDCADPAELARFYGRLLDLPVLYSSDDFVALGHAGQPGIALVRIDGYQRPPGRSQRCRSRPTSTSGSTTWTPRRPS